VPLKGTASGESGVIEPVGLEFGWVLEGLHYDAELFGFFLQGAELVRSCVGGGDVEIQADVFETYRDVLRNA